MTRSGGYITSGFVGGNAMGEHDQRDGGRGSTPALSDGRGSSGNTNGDYPDIGRFESLKEWYESDVDGPERRKIGTKPSAPIWQAFKNWVEAEHGMSHGVTAVELDAALIDRMGETHDDVVDRRIASLEERLDEQDSKLDTLMRLQNIILDNIEDIETDE